MKRRFLCAALAAASVLSLAACASVSANKDNDTYKLYYKTNLSYTAGGDAVGSESVEISKTDTAALAEDIIDKLLAGPDDTELISPFPAGTKLNSVKVSARHAQVDMSEQYGRLSGMDLTIADYCITLSLTQLSNIGSVAVTVNGEPIPYRDTQRFMSRDVLLSTMDDVVRTLTVKLYFEESSTGRLVPEDRTIELYEGETQADKVMSELLAGPENEAYISVIPEDVTVRYTQVDDGTCYVNLSQEFERDIPETSHEQNNVVYSIVNSLCSVNEINDVQILVNGAVVNSYGDVDISKPLS
ncbi:MAG: GerMN domain-containing protein [Oscillospiraceae bacterium]|nr:GerMN domain-containing protein [Oscillospiraceae bacterium]